MGRQGLVLVVLLVFLGGCPKYVPMSSEEIKARGEAYTACHQRLGKTSTTDTAGMTPGERIAVKALDLQAGHNADDPCARIWTSGDEAQSRIAKESAGVTKAGIGATASTASTGFMWLGVTKIFSYVKDMFSSAGDDIEINGDNNIGKNQQSAGRDANYQPSSVSELPDVAEETETLQ